MGRRAGERKGGGEREQSRLDWAVSVGQAGKLGCVQWVGVYREFMRRSRWRWCRRNAVLVASAGVD